jgi:hypothetical protein
VNTRLSDIEIRSTCLGLIGAGPMCSGRALRRALRDRFGASGRTDRVFRIWREVVAEQSMQMDLGRELTPRMWLERVAVAERQALAAETRAALAEHREQVHQDKWASEIFALRQRVADLEAVGGDGVSRQAHQQLQSAYLAARRRLARFEQLFPDAVPRPHDEK